MKQSDKKTEEKSVKQSDKKDALKTQEKILKQSKQTSKKQANQSA